ncbi:unnamed protein product [Blepharisma stoltei]|uniref:EGF-like domain-containing protein n=1 Tax=Blepharisma stoltei TaxID=1481888 RepID=A0AAU9IU65_9CILI|nr:unnamed protein product [Blepharisma stoltei]
MIVLLLFLAISATATTNTYLTFSSTSNPSSAEITLTTDISYFASNYQDYTIEFWMRPTWNTKTVSVKNVTRDSADWVLQYTPGTQTLLLNRQTTYINYCQFTYVPVGVWTHIMFAKTYSTLKFTCYMNGLSTNVTETGTASLIGYYPKYVYLGSTYEGNILDFRFWLADVRTEANVLKYMNHYFSSSFPSTLSLYWRLMNPSSTTATTLTESVAGNSASIGSSFVKASLWVSETSNDIVCATSQYIASGTCTACSSSCSMCTNSGLSCTSTASNYFDRGLDSTNTVYWVPTSGSAATFEFWVMPNTWDVSSQPVLYFQPVLLIQRKADTSNIVFINSASNENLQLSMPAKEWAHIAFTRSGTSNIIANIYFNGVLKYTGQWSSTFETIVDIWLGKTSSTSANFNGVLQELRLWSAVRTSSEIASYMNLKMGSTLPSTLSEYWPLNEGSGTTINDKKNSVSIYKSIIGNLWRSLDCTTEGCKILCTEGYYMNSTTGVCTACDVSCGLCNAYGASSCLTCATTYPYQISDSPICYSSCPSGYVLLTGTTTCAKCASNQFISSGSCVNCDSSCLTCSGSSSSQCLSCASGYTLVSGTCAANCQTGQYRDTPTTCKTCDSSCYTCSGSSSTCISCSSTLVLYNSQCVSSCPEATYNSGTSCISCDTSCATCNGGTNLNCVTCASGYPYRDSTGKCVASCPNLLVPSQNLCVDFCPTNYYASNSQCLPCDPSCSGCTGAGASNCAGCSNSYLYNGACYATCPSNTFVSGTSCANCDSTCSGCSGSASNQCTACATAYPYRESGTNLCVATCHATYYLVADLKSCVTSCPLGYYISGTNCLPCDTSCASCSGTSTSCTTCAAGQFLYSSQCLTSCPSTTYVEEGLCLACSTSCSTCNGPSSSNCTACPTGYYLSSGVCSPGCASGSYTLNGVCYTLCPSGYYGTSSFTCIACDSTCLNCNGPLATNCISCPTGKVLYSTSCVDQCPTQYYQDSSTNKCIQCASGCDVCTGSSIESCSQCSNSMLIYIGRDGTGSCVSTCPTGSYQNNTSCALCASSLCQQCTDQTSCQMCASGSYMSYLDSSQCLSSCSSGQLQDSTQRKCYGYTSRYPTGSINLSDLTKIQIAYPVSIIKGIGTINVYKITTDATTNILSLDTDSTSILLLSNTISIAVSSQLFSYSSTYGIEIIAGTITTSTGASNVLISKTDWIFTVNGYTYLPLVTIINKGLKGIEVPKSQSFVLDASNSYDPSGSLASVTLSYSWTCNDLSSNYQDYMTGISTTWADYVLKVSTTQPPTKTCTFWNYNSPPTTMVYTENNVLSVDTVLQYIFTMSDNNKRSSSSSIFVRVVSSSQTPLSFTSTPLYKINTDRPFQLAASTDYNYNPSGLKWIYTTTGQAPTFLTPLTGTWLLTVGENSMTAGASYTFSLTYTDNAVKTTAVVSVTTNTPPSGGLLYLDKTTGTALMTIFNGQMLGWVDDDLPLSYSFSVAPSYISGQNEIAEYLITGPQSSPVFATYFARGMTTVIGYCYDSYGAKSSSTLSITISDLTDIVKISDQSQLIPYETTENNAVISLQMSGAVAIQLNATFTDESSVLAIKTRLLSIVNQAILTADSLYTDGSQSEAVYIYYASMMALEPIVRQPSSLSICNTTLNYLNDIQLERLAVKQTLTVSSSNAAATSTQNVLSTKQFINLSQALSKIIIYITDLSDSSELISSVTELIVNINKVMSLDLQLTEDARDISLDRINVKAAKDLITNLKGTTLSLNNGASVKIPQLSGSESVQVLAARIENNPFDTTSTVSLDEFIQVDFLNADTGATIAMKNLSDPFLISFNVTRDSLSILQQRVSQERDSNVLIWPECSFWKNTSWSSDGCSLYNMGEVYTYFEFGKSIPNYFQLVCACNHLSQFSINFRASQQLQVPSYIIRANDDPVFSFRYWESAIVIYLMFIGLASYFIGLSFAYYWDNFNPGLSIPSVETEKSFRYCDPKKVEAVLSQLERELIRQLQDSNKSKKTANPGVYISKILSTGLVNKLMQQNEKAPKGQIEAYDISDQMHPIETLLYDENDYESNEYEGSQHSNKFLYKDETMLSRIKKYMKKGVGDPRYNPTVTSDFDAKGPGMLSRKDLESTIAQLKLHMNHLETNTQASTPIDQFLSRYDDSLKLSPNIIRRLHLDDKELKKGDLKSLGYSPQEFAAIRCDKDDNVIPDTTLLTGGKYSEKIVEEVKRFYYTLKLGYWSLFWLYFKKEHKFFALFYNLHIEYTKKQMVTLLAIFCIIQLLLCQVFIAYMNWEWEKTYNQNGVCIWGCNYESQLLAGAICAIIPWPIFYLCKYLFARNSVEYAAAHAWKVQAYQNKHCREMIGTFGVFIMFISIIAAIVIISVYEPFSLIQGEDFAYCYLASVIWSFFIGEFLGTLIKAWFIWMASHDFHSQKPEERGFWSELSRNVLTYLPCLLPTEL